MTSYSWASNPWVWAFTFRRVDEPPSGKPILFSGNMIRAILDGRKTQTRRVIAPQPEHRAIHDGTVPSWYWYSPRYDNGSGVHYFHTDEFSAKRLMLSACPYGIPGDRLWVRETLRYTDSDAICGIRVRYEADGATEWLSEGASPMPHYAPDKIRPSIHMPRWASRITLELTDVCAQRLQEISEEDARAEGSYLDRCECLPHRRDRTPIDKLFHQTGCHIHGEEFHTLWDSINAQRGPKRKKATA